ncbi:MAG: M23 family metallopeptidase [Pseudomonadota bacterium]
MIKNKVLLFLALSLAPALSLHAGDSDQLNNREISQKYFHPTRASLSGLRERGLEETGLVAVYPKDAVCPRADSFFADPKRGDGSARNPRFNHGMHAGLDIPAPEGTPILAIADGTVVAKKEETPDGIGGIGIIVQHAPADTGYSVWTYTRYKHLKEMPALEIGARVKIGQKIADTGTSGTSGRHYGGGGHSHLHLDLFVSPDDKYFSGEVVFFPINGQVADPLAIFRGEPMDTASVRKLSADQKKTVIPYMTESGKIVNSGRARVIWPYACKAASGS